MTAPDKLIKILDRILDGSRDESDIALLRQSLQADAPSYLVVCSRREEYEKIVRQRIEDDE